MLPNIVVEFRIDLVPGITLISKVAYLMAPKLLEMMKKQLVKLRGKG